MTEPLPILNGVGRFTKSVKSRGACVDCRFSAHDKDGTLGCRYDPPTAQIVQIPGKFGQMQTQTASLFPPVQPDMWCAKFEAVAPAVSGVSEALG